MNNVSPFENHVDMYNTKLFMIYRATLYNSAKQENKILKIHL